MRYLVFMDIPHDKKNKNESAVSSNKMRAMWVDSFARVEHLMDSKNYIGYVPETRWCKG